jgi:hypothetical protein
MIVKLLLILVLANNLAMVARSQLVDEKFCGSVVELIATPLRPVHWYRNTTFSDDCRFAFDIDKKGGVGVTVAVERFNSVSEARREYSSSIRMFDSPDFKLFDGQWVIDENGRRLSLSNNFWDASAFYDINSGPLVLRKKRTIITMFCDQRLLCIRFERLLTENPQLVNF